MSKLASFPIAKVYPAQHPDCLQLYSFPTPNGVKVSIMLEEIGLPYEAHQVDIRENQTFENPLCLLIDLYSGLKKLIV